jgi:amino acid adenylation domain-containing protein
VFASRDDDMKLARGVREQARSLGIEMWAEGPRLRYRAPDGDIPSSLRDALAGVRMDVLEILREERSEQSHLAPMSWNQFGMWHDQVNGGPSPGLNLGHAVRLVAPIRVELLTQATQVLVDRHEVLRTDFPRTAQVAGTGGRPNRRIRGVRPIAVDQRPATTPEALGGVLEALIQAPFDLEEAPLFRVHDVPLAEGGQVILLVGHHLVVDGLTIRLIGRELAQVYAALEADHPLPKSRSPEDAFSRFVDMQERYLAENAEQARAYWNRVFTPKGQQLALPLDRRTPHSQRHAHMVERRLCTELSNRIDRFARDAAATPFETLLTAYIAMLRRVTHQQDVVVGTAVHGRGFADLSRAFGTFVNLLPIRTRSPRDSSFRELLAETIAAVRSAQEFESFPYPLLVQELRETGAFLAPPVKTTFGLTDLEAFVEGSALPKTEQDPEILSLSQADAQFPLSLDMTRRGTDYHACWRYDPDRLLKSVVDGWACAFDVLLENALELPDGPLDAMLLRSFEEAELAGSTRVIGPSVTQRFAAHVIHQPTATATIDSAGSRTYEELSRRADAYTSELRDLDAGPSPRVGVCMERSSELVAALLGVWRAGGVYVPLDPTYPERRLERMASTAGLSAVITDLSENPIPGLGIPTLRSKPGDASSPSPRPLDISPDQPAYVMFTSGSSGEPKGVEISQYALANLLSSFSDSPGFGSSDVLLAVTTEAFDISILELLLPLYCGGSVAIASREDRADGRRLGDLIQAHHVTVMQATPSTWRMLLTSGWQGDPKLKVLCGGERLTSELADQLCVYAAEVWNLYGPTETTIWSTCTRVTQGEPPTLGRAIDNTQLLVVDDLLLPVPAGSVGQLLIGGAGVSRGYVSDEKLTSRRFITLPHSAERRWYQTGDLVRADEDGELHFIGTRDGQVKVRGARIEPGEVEAAIRKAAGISQVAVAVSDDRLVAFLVSEEAVSIDSLRTALEVELPRYMLPSLYIEVSDLPETLNGKLDRGALPELVLSGPATRSPSIALSDREEILAEVWRDLLGLEAVEPDDNFFHLGGHSLMAVECTTLIHSKVGIWLDPRDLFFKSLRQLALSLPKDAAQ